MKHQYSDATTRRYQLWLADRVKCGEFEPPRLHEIESWLRDSEDYRDSLHALRNLCVGLREAGRGDKCDPVFLQMIASALITELESERSFAAKADAFFSAAISRVGVEDYDVRMFDDRQRAAGTLHDLGLATKETANASV